MSIVDRLNPQRLQIVSGLIAAFAVGVFFFWHMLSIELPRMEWWHRILIWNGDAAAVLFAIRWAFAKDDDSYVNARRAALALAVSLLADVGLTVWGIGTEYAGWHRKVAAEARVVKLNSIDWQTDIATYYEIELDFPDQNGQRHRGMINFIRQKKKGFPGWVPMNLRQDFRQNRIPVTYPIFYDPVHPQRVWSKDEPWNRANALFYIFLMIHGAQILIAIAIIAKAFSRYSPRKNEVVGAIGFAPFAAQAGVMVFFGFLFWIRGF